MEKNGRTFFDRPKPTVGCSANGRRRRRRRRRLKKEVEITEHVAYLRYRKVAHLEDQGVDWRIILKWIFKKWDEGGVE